MFILAIKKRSEGGTSQQQEKERYQRALDNKQGQRKTDEVDLLEN